MKDFLSKFSASGGEYVRSIDPLNTFELTLKFHPSKIGAEEEGFFSKLGSSLGSSLLDTGINALNNATGGLTGNLFNKSIVDERSNFDGIHERSFMEYLVNAHLLKFSDAN